MRANAVCTLTLLLLLAGYHPSAFAQAGALTVYQGATLIDGVDNLPQKSLSILVRGARIQAISPASQLVPPAGCKVVDVTGLYVLPGLINTHVHIATDSTREQALSLM